MRVYLDYCRFHSDFLILPSQTEDMVRVFRERRAIARARLRTRLTHRRRAIYRSPEIMVTVHDD